MAAFDRKRGTFWGTLFRPGFTRLGRRFILCAFRAVKRYRGECVQRRAHIEQGRVRVDVRGQFRVTVPHGRLGRSKRYTRRRQVSAECVPEAMHVHNAAPVIALPYARKGQVPIEHLAQAFRHIEYRRIEGQPRRNRLSRFHSGPLCVFQAQGKPCRLCPPLNRP